MIQEKMTDRKANHKTGFEAITIFPKINPEINANKTEINDLFLFNLSQLNRILSTNLSL